MFLKRFLKIRLGFTWLDFIWLDFTRLDFTWVGFTRLDFAQLDFAGLAWIGDIEWGGEVAEGLEDQNLFILALSFWALSFLSFLAFSFLGQENNKEDLEETQTLLRHSLQVSAGLDTCYFLYHRWSGVCWEIRRVMLSVSERHRGERHGRYS